MLIAALLPVAAAAHPLSVSYSRFELKDQALIATIRLPTDDADLLLQLDEDLDGRVSEARAGVEFMLLRIDEVAAIAVDVELCGRGVEKFSAHIIRLRFPRG